MSNEVAKQEKQLHIMQKPEVKAKFEEMLGKKTPSFITSVMSAITSNAKLLEADQNSVYMAAMMAASLDLPINQNLGFAYIVPFWDGKTGKNVAQFQLGYKGFIQLAQRSGQFLTIGATPIYEDQLISANPLTNEYKFDFAKTSSSKIIGYASYFELLNGYKMTLYLTKEEAERHGKEYSQTYKKGFGLWKDKFDSMALKTVIKMLLSRYAPLSIEMQKAVIADSSIIKNAETLDVDYTDNEQPTAQEVAQQKEYERVSNFINNAQTLEELNQAEKHLQWDQIEMFNTKKKELSK